MIAGEHRGSQAAGASGRADQAEFHGGPAGYSAGLLKTGHDGGRFPEEFDGVFAIGLAAAEPGEQFIDQRPIDIEADAARTDHATSEAAAAEQGGHVEEIAADSAAIAGGGKKSDIAGQGTQVADVIGQAFQFQGDAAKGLGSRRVLTFAQCFHALQ